MPNRKHVSQTQQQNRKRFTAVAAAFLVVATLVLMGITGNHGKPVIVPSVTAPSLPDVTNSPDITISPIEIPSHLPARTTQPAVGVSPQTGIIGATAMHETGATATTTITLAKVVSTTTRPTVPQLPAGITWEQVVRWVKAHEIPQLPPGMTWVDVIRYVNGQNKPAPKSLPAGTAPASVETVPVQRNGSDAISIAQSVFSEEDPGLVARIVTCESGGNPSASTHDDGTGYGAYGLWQIHSEWAKLFVKHGWNFWDDWADPYKNSVVAHDIWLDNGGTFAGQWACS